MADNLVEELLTQLDVANAQLREKEELIGKLKSETLSAQGTGSWGSKLISRMARALKIQGRTVVTTETADAIKIEFPHAVHLEIPTLVSQQSLRTQFRAELEALQPCFRQKTELRSEYEQKLKVLEDEYLKNSSILNGSYEQAIAEVDSQIQSFMSTVQARFTGLLLGEVESLAVYTIDRVDAEHSNGITLLTDKEERKDITSMSGVYILSVPEAQLFYESMQTTQHSIEIQYQLIDLGEGEKACYPYHISPDSIKMDDVSGSQYEINFQKSENRITKVTSKKDGEVKFNAIEVDTECGFVTSSLVELYTSRISDTIFNIVHMHVDDVSEEIPIEAVYLLPEQDSSEYEEFKVDGRGVMLRYKVLVKEGRVDSVLYNPGGGVINRLEFIERTITEGTLVKYSDCIAKVVRLPTGMLARAWESRDEIVPSSVIREAPIAFCNGRHVEDIPGLIELEIVFDGKKLIQTQTRVVVPVCETRPVSRSEETRLTELVQSEEKMHQDALYKATSELEGLLTSLNTSHPSNVQEAFNKLREVSTAFRSLLKTEDQAAGYASLLQRSDRLLRSLAIEVRMQGT